MREFVLKKEWGVFDAEVPLPVSRGAVARAGEKIGESAAARRRFISPLFMIGKL